VISANSITAVVGSGSSGPISVTTPGGTATISAFGFLSSSAPVISSFSPASAQSGQAVLIKGAHFKPLVRVYFGGVAARSLTLLDSTTIIAVVGNGASGNVSVTTHAGTASSPGFTFLNTPLAQPKESPGTEPPIYAWSAEEYAEQRIPQPPGHIPFLLYPNPSSGEVHLVLTDTEAERPAFLRVVDALGREVERIPRWESPIHSLNLSGFPPGIYYFFLFDEQHRVLGKQVLVLR
jgi:hypothetical protein